MTTATLAGSACLPAVTDQESRLLAALGAATAFRVEGGKLLLLDENGRVRVRLAPHGPRRRASAPPPNEPAASPPRPPRQDGSTPGDAKYAPATEANRLIVSIGLEHVRGHDERRSSPLLANDP